MTSLVTALKQFLLGRYSLRSTGAGTEQAGLTRGGAGRGFNIIYIEHEDGTSAFYAHLQQQSARVKVGDQVGAGQVIALSGASGTSLEHLHFGVAGSWPVRKPDDLLVNFRNSQGALDERGGLQRGVVYRAVPYSEN